MKEIILRNSAIKAIVDDEDFERLNQHKWYYTTAVFRVKTALGHTRNYSMAGDVMQTKGVMYDHIDRNPFNNQKSNLRVCNRVFNGANTSKQKGTRSKYKGVDYHKNGPTWWWRARIMFAGVRQHIGSYKTEEEAGRAYDKRAVELFGEFANLNFPKQ